jgi:hypothetical protein
MELEQAPLSVAIIGLTFLVMVTMALFLNTFGNSIPLENNGVSSYNFTYISAQTLPKIGEGITSSSFKVLNDTNDYLRITPSSNKI